MQYGCANVVNVLADKRTTKEGTLSHVFTCYNVNLFEIHSLPIHLPSPLLLSPSLPPTQCVVTTIVLPTTTTLGLSMVANTPAAQRPSRRRGAWRLSSRQTEGGRTPMHHLGLQAWHPLTAKVRPRSNPLRGQCSIGVHRPTDSSSSSRSCTVAQWERRARGGAAIMNLWAVHRTDQVR